MTEITNEMLLTFWRTAMLNGLPSADPTRPLAILNPPQVLRAALEAITPLIRAEQFGCKIGDRVTKITDEIMRVAYDAALPYPMNSEKGLRAALGAITPLIRAHALEEAAQACDWHSTRAHTEGTPEDCALSYSYSARDCATTIRALKETKDNAFMRAEPVVSNALSRARTALEAKP